MRFCGWALVLAVCSIVLVAVNAAAPILDCMFMGVDADASIQH